MKVCEGMEVSAAYDTLDLGQFKMFNLAVGRVGARHGPRVFREKLPKIGEEILCDLKVHPPLIRS